MANGGISKIPLVAQLLIAVAVAIVIAGAFWYWAWSPMVAEEAQMRTKLEGLQAQIRSLEITASRLQEFHREVALLERRLETLKLILPPEKETPDLIRKIHNLASESNLKVSEFSPGAVASKDFYQEYPISLRMSGTYHNLGSFFDRVGRLSRLVNASNIKIAAVPNQSAFSTISASCVATTYVYIEAPAQPATAPKKP